MASCCRNAVFALVICSILKGDLSAQRKTTAVVDSLRGAWSAEFWKAMSVDSTLGLTLEVSFDRVDSDSSPQTLTGEYHLAILLGEDPLARLFGHSDECVHPDGQPIASVVSPDSIEIVFTPDANDCGLVAVGVLRGDLFVGRWYEPRFSDPRPHGPFRMRRRHR